MVEIQGLTKAFGSQVIFKDLTVQFPRGKLTVIMGPSGCGKTTLLRCINFLELFDSGKISIGDLSVEWSGGQERGHAHHDKVHAMRLKTGMVFQSFNLFPHLTVLQNIVLAPTLVKKVSREAAHEDARRLLRRVGLADKAETYPSRLSGGQQQRVAIARSLAMQPEVLLYDEPTSQLDPQLVDEVFAVMRELDKDGITQIAVTHHERFAREVADRALVLSDGKAEWQNL